MKSTPIEKHECYSIALKVIASKCQIKEKLQYTITPEGFHSSERFAHDTHCMIGRTGWDQYGNAINDIILEHESISRVHAQISFKSNKFWILDSISSNGTFVWVNKPIILTPGLVLSFGIEEL